MYSTWVLHEIYWNSTFYWYLGFKMSAIQHSLGNLFSWEAINPGWSKTSVRCSSILYNILEEICLLKTKKSTWENDFLVRFIKNQVSGKKVFHWF